jgi:glutathione S-transferase
MPAIEVIQFPGTGRLESVSPYCVKVQRILRYKRLPFTVRDTVMPPRRSVDPAGKLPILVYDGARVPDSTRIALFIEERHPTPVLVPPVAEDRARVLLLEDWADESLYWALLYVRWKLPENVPRMRAVFAEMMGLPLSLIGPAVVARQLRRALDAQGTGRLDLGTFRSGFHRALASLDAVLTGRDYLCGATLTLADIAVFSMLHGIREAPLPAGTGELEGFAALLRWYDRVASATGPA